MKKKWIIIVIILILVISIYAVFSFTKKPEVKYTTEKVTRGDVLQTVSATGTVEAATKLDLRFGNTGKVSEINVKVGDSVSGGMVLAKLNTSQLESQLSKASANLIAARANYNKLIVGATPEDIKISETAVENAQISLDNARQNLVDVRLGASKDIASAEASRDSTQVSLANATLSLINTITSNENNLNEDYEDAWDTINSSLLTAYDALNINETTLNYEDAQDTLSVLNMQYLNNSNQSKIIANNSYDSTKSYIDSIKSDLTHEKIDQSLKKTKSLLEMVRITLGDTGSVLQSTITSSKLSQTELDSLKSNISAERTSVNVAISNITIASQNISSRKITNQINIDNAQAIVNSAESALNSAKQSLASIKSSVKAKINTSENAVKSAEGALKQAQDQLALKKAEPSSSDISLYKARIQEAQANVDLIQSQINDSILISPRSGIITEINSEVGEIISSAEIFISIISAGNFEIKANISEVDIAKIKLDNSVEITFDAFGSGKKFQGKIINIEPAETEISGVVYYKITIVFSGNSQIIKSGMTANIDIMTAERNDVIMIPFQAFKEKDGQDYVQVLKDDIVKDISIEVGLRGDINIEVISGLKEGQDVVTFVEE